MNGQKLLTKGISSPKLAKYTGDGYMSAILYLASANYKRELCPAAGACMKACLIVKAGRGAFDDKVSAARKRKSDWLLNDREAFIDQLYKEIWLLQYQAWAKGKRLAVRLNGGSDLDWSDIYERFPMVQFWEYTKRPDLALKLKRQFSNVHVTFSASENLTERIAITMFQQAINIAMVFDVPRGQRLPYYGEGALHSVRGQPVLDGDLHDFRFLDPNDTGYIVGLRLKSNTRPTVEQKSGGFVVAA